MIPTIEGEVVRGEACERIGKANSFFSGQRFEIFVARIFNSDSVVLAQILNGSDASQEDLLIL
jgi:hypothetical protein